MAFFFVIFHPHIYFFVPVDILSRAGLQYSRHHYWFFL